MNCWESAGTVTAQSQGKITHAATKQTLVLSERQRLTDRSNWTWRESDCAAVCGDRFLNGSIKPYTDSETERVSVFLHSAGMRVLDVGQVRANDPVWSDTSFSKTTKEAVSLEILPVGDWWGFLVSYQHRCWMQKYASLSEKCPLVAIKRGS